VLSVGRVSDPADPLTLPAIPQMVMLEPKVRRFGGLRLTAILLAVTFAVLLSSSPSSWAVQHKAAALTPPVGYSARQLIFQDRFSGSHLDSSKWVPYIGGEGIRWDDRGALPAPFSGPNTPITAEAAMFGPSQVRVHNGLTLTAQRNTNVFASAYPWISGVVSTEGKFSLPASGWYVQVKAKMPDTRLGMWPAIWFLRGTPGYPDNELDLQEGGQQDFADPNVELHSDYFSNQGQQQIPVDTGVNLSRGYHLYGVKFLPNRSITGYFDGREVWQLSTASGITIAAQPYEIILQLEVASPVGQPAGHTVSTGATSPASMTIAEVQAYS
jgi:beta-glucanase (GH16 family)